MRGRLKAIYSRYNHSQLLIISLSLVSIITQFGILGLVVSLIISYKLFDFGVLAGKKLTRSILSLIIYITILQSVILAVWLYDHDFPLHLSLWVTLGVLLITYILHGYYPLHKKALRTAVTPKSYYFEAIAVSVSLVICGLVVIGPVLKSNDLSNNTLLQYINTSLDDSNHLSRINDRTQLDRGVLSETDKTQYVVLTESISSYPPAWHSANVVVMKAIYPPIKVGMDTVVAYVAAKIFWLFILVYIFIAAIFISYDLLIISFKTNKKALSVYLWLTGAGLYFAYYALVEQFREGFFSFIPQLTMLLCILIIFALQDKREMKSSSFVILLILAAGITYSWILALPAVVIALLIATITKYNIRSIGMELWRLVKESLVYMVPVIFCGLGIIVQLYLILTTNYRSFAQAINDPGAISMHSDWYYAFILMGVLLFFFYIKSRTYALHGITGLLLGLAGLSLFIYLFQIYTTGQSEYYFLKTLNTFVITALPLAIAGWCFMVVNIVDKLDPPVSFAAVCLALVTLPLIIGVNPTNVSNISYIKGVRDMSQAELDYISNSIDTRTKFDVSKRTGDVIFFTPGRVGHNIVATNILRSIQRIDTCDDKAFSALLNDSVELLLASVENCELNRELTVVTNQESFDEVSNLFRGQNVHILAIN